MRRSQKETIAEVKRELLKRCGPKKGDGWMDLVVPAHVEKDYENGDHEKNYEIQVPEKTYRVPRAPFERWCLSRTSGEHLSDWKPISPSGMKLQLDDPTHTDWMIGAGFTPDDDVWGSFSHPIMTAAHALKSDLQEKLLGFKVQVLNDGKYVSGLVQHAKPNEPLARIKRVPTNVSHGEPGKPSYRKWENIKKPLPVIAVIPEPTPEYVPAMLSADAVILTRGTSLIHLVIVGREKKKVIVVDADAIRKYPPGTELSVDPEAGKIEVDGFRFSNDYYWYFKGDWVPEGTPEPEDLP